MGLILLRDLCVALTVVDQQVFCLFVINSLLGLNYKRFGLSLMILMGVGYKLLLLLWKLQFDDENFMLDY